MSISGGGGKATGAVGARPKTEIYMSITKKEKELAQWEFQLPQDASRVRTIT
jgi:hypothetical protein